MRRSERARPIEAAGVKRFRLHMTNVSATGATQLVQSLLPALESRPGFALEEIFLPQHGQLSDFKPKKPGTKTTYYTRLLPNSVSRFLECTVFARRFEADTPLLVLGDLPLSCRGRQSVFVHNRFIIEGDPSSGLLFSIRSGIYRRVFRSNLRYASSVIVQSELMKEAIVARHPGVAGTIHVIPQPAPQWLLASGLRRTGKAGPVGSKLVLFYPADSYPHKNHGLLETISASAASEWPVLRLTMTIPPTENPNLSVPWISCVGTLSSSEMIRAYRETDALLFLSTKESYGLPLIEAMAVGIPIVCPDLPYARNICGDGAVYFEPSRVDSLKQAVMQLNERVNAGWWPDWSEQLRRIPATWDHVAEAMLATLFD